MLQRNNSQFFVFKILTSTQIDIPIRIMHGVHMRKPRIHRETREHLEKPGKHHLEKRGGGRENLVKRRKPRMGHIARDARK